MDVLLSNLFTLLMLVLLQAVLGFDNLLYISIESKRVVEEKQQSVRRLGIGLAIGLRIVLLMVMMKVTEALKNPFLTIGMEVQEPREDHTEAVHDLTEIEGDVSGIFAGSFNGHSIIVLIGGAFILYTALKEISHMLAVHDVAHGEKKEPRSVGSAIFWIVLMNLVFSFDSILSALAFTRVFWVLAGAIIISGVMMIVLADHVAEFIKKNRMFEILGLFVLFIVGVLLLSEGAHLAHLHLFGYAIHPMAHSTFYFVIAVLVLIDLAQGRYQKKLAAQRKHEQEAHA